MSHPVTGDRYLETLLPSAELLVRATHAEQLWAVEAALADAETVYPDPLVAARALVVLLAAMVPDDRTPAELLAWRRNPHEYRRLRAAGVDADQARQLAAGVSPLKRGDRAS